MAESTKIYRLHNMLNVESDYIPTRYGRWSTLGPKFWLYSGKSPYRYARQVCICECGTIGIVRIDCITKGKSQSCGCLHREIVSKYASKHSVRHGNKVGKKATREYVSWRAMKARCLNSKHGAYGNYGGRGIKICARWLVDFANFLEDMGPRPPGKSLDRIDINGDYTPENCKWSTPKEQANNRRKRRK